MFIFITLIYYLLIYFIFIKHHSHFQTAQKNLADTSFFHTQCENSNDVIPCVRHTPCKKYEHTTLSYLLNVNYNIPRACLLNRSPVPAMDLDQACDVTC